jgi:CubicO group peptidase (beta-lactamase class C family)
MPTWLQPALAYIDDWLELQVRHARLPGLSVAIAERGRVVLERAYGVANIATGEPLTPAHRFRVASHSKSFTAAAVMKLREAGRLRLDDTAGATVSGLHRSVARATIAQLLSHTAGIIRDGTDAGQWADRRPFLNEPELRAALAEAPILPANTRVKYSNHGFGLAGLVIEAVTGEPYGAWVAREIVGASGLAHTLPDAPVAPRTPFARGHATALLLGERFVIPADNPTNALAAATGFVSTAGDLVRFFGQLSPLAPKSVLSVESRREMTRRHWRVPDMPVARWYGLGTIHGEAGAWRWFGHSGGFQGVVSQTVVVPDQHLVVSILINATDGLPAALADGALRILQAFAEHGAPAKRLADWRGRWWSLWGVLDLLPMGNKVFVTLPQEFNPLLAASEIKASGDNGRIVKAGGFASHGETARLVRTRGREVQEVWVGGSKLQREAAAVREARKRYLAD